MTELLKVAEAKGDKRASVVFFHGLGGDAKRTWRASPDDSSFWPAWLAQDIEGLSVYSLGYEAPVSRWRGSAMSLFDRGVGVLLRLLNEPGLEQGPLVLIGHSLGGLVIKQLLRTAEIYKHKDAPKFLSRVGSIVFLATPHTGAGLANLGDRLRIFVRPSAATASLVRNDPYLRDLNSWYQTWSSERNIYHLVLYETKPLSVFGMIVPPDTGNPGFSKQIFAPIYADHHGICKPHSREDDVYIHVRAFIKSNAIVEPITGTEAIAEEAIPKQSILEEAKKCLDLLSEINAANDRIIQRGHTAGGPWPRILSDTYNNVCKKCHERRFGTQPPDTYFDAICAEPDVDTLCVKKWELGEALDDYRNLVNRVSSHPLAHHDLELKIRRSVTQPDWSPEEFQKVLGEAIEAAKQVLAQA
jgi:pimeloyl-ACP methyl ester carboxylesterase